jgi:hypothetical protein
VQSIVALRAESARAAVDAAIKLPIGHPDRDEILVMVGNICRKIERSDPDTYFQKAIAAGMAANDDAQKALNQRWFRAMRAYCGSVSGMALIEQAASERSFAPAAEAAQAVDDHAFVSALAQLYPASGAEIEAGVEEKLWDLLDNSGSYSVLLMASHQLASVGAGAFGDTGQLTGRGSRLWARPDDERMAEIRDAAAWLFLCRTFQACGPGTAFSLRSRWISNAQATIGFEGMLRSQHSPIEWEAIESISWQLQQRRGRSRPG